MNARPLPPAGVYTAREVAARLGLTAGRFAALRDELEARGFPAPLLETAFLRAGRTRVRRASWSRRQVDDWIDGMLTAAAAGARPYRHLAPGADPELAERARRLAGIAAP